MRFNDWILGSRPRCGRGVLIVLLLTSPADAQERPDTLDTDRVEEALLEDIESETGDPSQLAELLDDLRATPLDVNTASASALAEIPALDPRLAHSIVQHRQQHGAFSSLDALRNVAGMTEAISADVRPYLTTETASRPSRFDPAPRLGALLHSLRMNVMQRIERRLELGRGYDEAADGMGYAGSPERLYTRLRATSGRQFSANLTLEKDPGEAFRWEPGAGSYGYDHVTAHVALRNYGRLRSLVAGDYVAQFGQGVVFWRSSAFGKGRSPVRPLVRSGRGLVPYGSAEENGFLRGVAATIRATPFLDVSTFVSRRTLDARLLDADTTSASLDPLVATAGLTQSGLHRTPTERSQKDAVRETLLGSHVEIATGSVAAGMIGYQSHFDRPFQPGDAPYERFRFAGRRHAMLGVFASATLGHAYLFGEIARSSDATLGGIGGLSIHLSERAEMLILIRHFPHDFASLHGFAFGERNGATQNETGFYAGIDFRPARHWRIAAFVDQYRFPWLRFGVPRPSTGYETLLLVEYQPRRWINVYVQARNETKEQGATRLDVQGHPLEGIRRETRQSVRLHGDYDFGPRLRLRARLEATRFRAESDTEQRGFLLYQDVRWRLASSLRLDVRLALFDTDGFGARIFTYENDLRYVFAVPAFSGRGQRAYLLAQWALTSTLTLEAKAGWTRFEDIHSIGSSLDEVAGNQLRDVRLQASWRF